MRTVRIALVIALTCLLAVAVVGCGTKIGTAPDGNENDIANTTIRVAGEVAGAPYTLLSTEQMKDWVDLGEIMTVIDVREESDYLKGHLPGAVNARITEDVAPAVAEGEEEPAEAEQTPEDATAQVEAFLALLPDNHESIVVVYDGYTALSGSHRAAIYATDAGYTKVYRLLGGAAAWTAAGYKLTKK